MNTKRVPINRPQQKREISARALELFNQMRQAVCTCERKGEDHWRTCPARAQWWALHSELHDELHLTPLDWPAIVNPMTKYASDADRQADHAAHARWRRLERAAKS
jgi:hypothetical protein